jgi:hypothetical protein
VSAFWLDFLIVNFASSCLLISNVSDLLGTPESVYIFIDNSNVYIQKKEEISVCESVPENLVRIDYGNLVEMGHNSRHMGAVPVIVGSRSPSQGYFMENS